MNESRDDGDKAAVPKPSLTTTYCWADGDLIGDDYGWMPEIELYQDSVEYGDDPRDVLVETWQRTSFEVRTLFPPLSSCTYADGEPCEEDAVAWQQENNGEAWMQACERHRHTPHIASHPEADQ